MMRLCFLPLLFVTLLLGAMDDATLLQRAKNAAASSDKTEIFKAYNDYKSLYLRSMTGHDDALRRSALEGIVTTGKTLHIDVARYRKELAQMPAATSSAPAAKAGPAPAASGSGLDLAGVQWRDGRIVLTFDRPLQRHEVNYFKLFDKGAKRYRYIFDVDAVMGEPREIPEHDGIKRISLARYNAAKLRLVLENDAPLKLSFKRDGRELVVNPGAGPRPEPKQPTSVTVAKRLHLEKAFWREGDLVLKFDRELASDALSFSKLEEPSKKRYRYLFDVDDAMLDKQHDLRHADLERISLAQFDSATMRLVIENDARLAVSNRISGSEVVIKLGTSGRTDPTPVATDSPPPGFEKVIVIDPGHGGRDAGAVGYKKYREKVVVMQIANELAKILKKQGYKVQMTRSGDQFIKLQQRTKFANRKSADLFISIHANAVPKRNADKAYGIETYFLSNDHEAGSERAKRVAQMENSKDLQDVNFYGQQDFINILNREKIKKSERLAYDLQRNILAVLQKHYKGVKDGGVREGPFWILVGAQMPAVLVEVGFITHPSEAKRLVNRTYQKRMAEGLANGINRYFINNP